MKKNSPIFIFAAVAAVYFGLTGSLQAVPPAPVNIPDGGSTVLMIGTALGGICFLKWKLIK
jgi:hypothetical protein